MMRVLPLAGSLLAPAAAELGPTMGACAVRGLGREHSLLQASNSRSHHRKALDWADRRAMAVPASLSEATATVRENGSLRALQPIPGGSGAAACYIRDCGCPGSFL